jgi:hypothetical protein
MSYTETSLKDRIKRRLGYGTVSVELTDSQLQDAIQSALDVYNSYVGRIFWQQLSVSDTQTRYDLSGQQYSAIQNISAIQFVPKGQQNTMYSGMYESSGLPFTNFNDQGLAFRDFREQLQISEQLFDTIPDFVFDRDNRILYLKVPLGAREVTLVCSALATVSQIRYNLSSIFVDGCVAYAKEILGIIRRKYQGATLPGGEVNLDGAELSNEAKDEKELYEKKLQSHLSDVVLQA